MDLIAGLIQTSILPAACWRWRPSAGAFRAGRHRQPRRRRADRARCDHRHRHRGRHPQPDARLRPSAACRPPGGHGLRDRDGDRARQPDSLWACTYAHGHRRRGDDRQGLFGHSRPGDVSAGGNPVPQRPSACRQGAVHPERSGLPDLSRSSLCDPPSFVPDPARSRPQGGWRNPAARTPPAFRSGASASGTSRQAPHWGRRGRLSTLAFVPSWSASSRVAAGSPSRSSPAIGRPQSARRCVSRLARLRGAGAQWPILRAVHAALSRHDRADDRPCVAWQKVRRSWRAGAPSPISATFVRGGARRTRKTRPPEAAASPVHS